MNISYFDQVAEAVGFLRAMLGPFDPRSGSKIGIVLGSGLGAVADAIIDPVVVPYAEIPHFPKSTVEGHTGRIIAGFLNGIPSEESSSFESDGGIPVVMMQGRVHSYEGYSPAQVTFPMRVLGALGVRSVVLTNAAGGIAESYHIGQLVALADHINFMGWNPLVGKNEPRFGFRPGFPPPGLRFLDMTEAYSRGLRALAQEAAAEEKMQLDEGIYLGVSGPSFETPAEIRAFRTLGATLVGMSTVPETIVARHMGLEVLGLSCVTNLAAMVGAAPLSHEEVFEAGQRVEFRLTRLLERLVPKIAARINEAEMKATDVSAM
jgi:purine-nucleoside phosphorylase